MNVFLDEASNILRILIASPAAPSGLDRRRATSPDNLLSDAASTEANLILPRFRELSGRAKTLRSLSSWNRFRLESGHSCRHSGPSQFLPRPALISRQSELTVSQEIARRTNLARVLVRGAGGRGGRPPRRKNTNLLSRVSVYNLNKLKKVNKTNFPFECSPQRTAACSQRSTKYFPSYLHKCQMKCEVSLYNSPK